MNMRAAIYNPGQNARRYIKVRLQVITSPGLICPLCPVTYAPIQHALWQCPAQTNTRDSLLANATLRSVHAATYMRTLDSVELTHFITGGGMVHHFGATTNPMYSIHLGHHREYICKQLSTNPEQSPSSPKCVLKCISSSVYPRVSHSTGRSEGGFYMVWFRSQSTHCTLITRTY